MHQPTSDLRIRSTTPLPAPAALEAELPLDDAGAARVAAARREVSAVMAGRDDRLLVVVGPCSIHYPDAALEYAGLLRGAAAAHAGELLIAMRVYFEKPRTVVGWKGLINDPDLDGTFHIGKGLRLARQLMVGVTAAGLPIATEFLDTTLGQYYADLVSWGAIGARTVESQVHRELASGLSAPVGFKNGTDGNLKIAIDAIQAAARPHHFLSVHKNGQVAIVETRGNKDCHVILRGGKAPNYDAASVKAACGELEAAKLDCKLMIDFSHANSEKKFERQVAVARDVGDQVASGNGCIFGVMVESHLVAGAQKFTPGKDDPTKLEYGKSITDGCIGWDDSITVLDVLRDAVLARRQAKR